MEVPAFFMRQDGHLTSNGYGVTFIFDLESISIVGIHDFQDLIVLRRAIGCGRSALERATTLPEFRGIVINSRSA